MADTCAYIALFHEDKVDTAAEAVIRLRSFGLRDKDIAVLSGVPYGEKILGRPMAWTRIPLIAMAGAVVGLLTALAMVFIPQLQYPLVVGGMPYVAVPTSIVVVFELTMLGLLLSTFIGVFIETISPSFGPKVYHPKISDGYIGVVYNCPYREDQRIQDAMVELGAEIVTPEGKPA